MKRYVSTTAFMDELGELIEGWCGRRCLRSLGAVLPAYNSFNGMTDGWGELLKALKSLAMTQEELLPKEREVVADLRAAVEEMFRS